MNFIARIISSSSILTRLAFAYQHWLYKRDVANYKIKHGGWFDLSFNLLMAKAVAGAPWRFAVSGDSRIAELMFLITKQVGWFCGGVSGAKTEDDLKRMLAIINASGAPVVFDDIDGNNFLAGESLNMVVQLKTMWLQQLVATRKKIFVFDLCPISAEAEAQKPGINAKIAAHNEWLYKIAPALGVTVVPIAAKISQGPAMAEKYSADGIHWALPVSWDEVIWPAMKNALIAAGISL